MQWHTFVRKTARKQIRKFVTAIEYNTSRWAYVINLPKFLCPSVSHSGHHWTRHFFKLILVCNVLDTCTHPTVCIIVILWKHCNHWHKLSTQCIGQCTCSQTWQASTAFQTIQHAKLVNMVYHPNKNTNKLLLGWLTQTQTSPEVKHCGNKSHGMRVLYAYSGSTCLECSQYTNMYWEHSK